MKYKNLISKTDEIAVYEQDGMAIKIFDNKIPKSKVFYEAMIQAKIEETGLNIPKVRQVFKTDDGWAIASDYIKGKTLAELMDEEPENRDDYLDDLVELQLEIHAISIPDITKLKHKLQREINSLTNIDSVKKYELLTRLDSMPKHSKLCHGNFGPEHVIITDEGVVYLLDWVAATRGNASADVAKTYLKLMMKSTEMAEKYMTLFCQKTGTAKKYVQEWLPIIAAQQLAEGVTSKLEKEVMLTWLDVVDYS